MKHFIEDLIGAACIFAMLYGALVIGWVLS